MSTGNVVVSQDAPAKNNLWIQPKGTARFWNGSIWKTISGSGGGEVNEDELWELLNGTTTPTYSGTTLIASDYLGNSGNTDYILKYNGNYAIWVAQSSLSVGSATTATTASKLGTSTVGNSITPFYLNSGVATVCSLYRYHYDGNSDYASYAWHKVAYAEATASTDKEITFLISKSNNASVNGILRCRARWDANTVFNSTDTKIYWLVNSGITLADFVMVWKSPNLELWCKMSAQWQGWHFTVLDSGLRQNNGSLSWILCNSINGHGSASYTSDGTVITSAKTTLTNNLSGTVNGYTLSSTVNAGTANRLAYYTSSGIDDASTTYVSNTKLAINSTSEPSYNLYVNGTSYLNGNVSIGDTSQNTQNLILKSAQAQLRLISYSNGENYIESGNTSWSGVANLHISGYNDNGINKLTLKAISTYISGNVGIGTDSPPVKLSVAGDIYASGGVTALATVSSDKRLKKNIKLFNATEIVDKLKPVQFEWNNKAKKYSDTFKDGKNYGLLAQDSDGIIDDLVFDLPDGKGYKGVRYEKLIPILLQAIKELKQEINNLKNK